MGTNFYARVIPKKSRIENLKKSIDKQDIEKINEQIQEAFGLVDEYNRIGSIYHLGKRSYGWKFLWNPNCFEKRNFHNEETIVDGDDGQNSSIIKFVPDPSTLEQKYELTKQGIVDFICRDDIVVVDEYVKDKSIHELKDIKDSDEHSTVLFDEDEKIAWVEKMIKLDGYDGESYDKDPKYASTCSLYLTDNTENNEFGTLIKAKYPNVRFTGHHDFYNDGLRFSTSTSFS